MKWVFLITVLLTTAPAAWSRTGKSVDIAEDNFSAEDARMNTADSVILRNLWFSDKLLPEAEKFTHKNMVDLERTDYHNLLSRFQFGESDMEAPVFSKREEIFASEDLNSSSPDAEYRPKKVSYIVYDGILRARLPADGAREAGKTAREIKFIYYEANVERERPLVLILPPIMGATVVDRDIAELLARNGMDTIIPEMEELFTPDKSLEEMNTVGVQAIVSLRMLTSAILSDKTKRIDSGKVGAFGVSLGAIIAASLAGIDNNIKYAYLIVGGGNFADIATNSSQNRIVTFRNYNFTTDGQLRSLPKGKRINRWFRETREKVYSDPVYFARNAVHKKIYMVMSTNDDMIPFRDQLELWNAFGHPKYELSRLSHIGTVVRWYINYRYSALDFFSKE
ncbi:MAG TPA: hypothetical protein DCL44_12210 [Elusimicrobia bacterium]|nr:hypothetical protein [Elusimicrobiota bacterium]